MTGRLAWAVAFSALWAATVNAHVLGRSESAVRVSGREVRARLTLDLLELGGVDVNSDGEVSYGELDAAVPRIYDVLKRHYAVESGTPPVRTSLERYAVRDGHVAELDFLFGFDSDVTRLVVRSSLHQILQPTHEHVVSVAFGDTPATTTLLDATRTEAVFAAPPARNKFSTLFSSRRIVVNLLAALVIAAVSYSGWRLRRGAR